MGEEEEKKWRRRTIISSISELTGLSVTCAIGAALRVFVTRTYVIVTGFFQTDDRTRRSWARSCVRPRFRWPRPTFRLATLGTCLTKIKPRFFKTFLAWAAKPGSRVCSRSVTAKRSCKTSTRPACSSARGRTTWRA